MVGFRSEFQYSNATDLKLKILKMGVNLKETMNTKFVSFIKFD